MLHSRHSEQAELGPTEWGKILWKILSHLCVILRTEQVTFFYLLELGFKIKNFLEFLSFAF